jgi:hypothetical protein
MRSGWRRISVLWSLSGILLSHGRVLACSCGFSAPLCSQLAVPGTALSLDPGSAIFVGKVVYSHPSTILAYFELEKEYAANHPDGRSDGKVETLTFEGRKQFLLSLWRDALSSKSREAILASPENPGGFSAIPRYAAALTRIEVLESFHGIRSGEVVDLFGGLGSTDCSFHFKPGTTYLIFAQRDDNGLWTTSVCLRTRQIETARFDLEALRAHRDGTPLPRAIYGTVSDQTNRGQRHRDLFPVGFALRLVGDGIAMEARTGVHGMFSFENLSPGKYRLEPVAPGWSLGVVPRRSHIEIAGGCSEVFVSVRERQSSIVGIARPTAGFALSMIPVQLINATPKNGIHPPEGRIDAAGNLRIAGVEPGDYLLGVNVTTPPRPSGSAIRAVPYPASYYPGVPRRENAEIIHVKRGDEVRLPGVWQLPAPLTQRNIEGFVLMRDGTAASDVRLWLKDREGNVAVGRAGPTKADGRFQFSLLAGRSYQIEAGSMDPPQKQFFFGVLDIDPDHTGIPIVTLIEDGPRPRDPMMFFPTIWTPIPVYPR